MSEAKTTPAKAEEKGVTVRSLIENDSIKKRFHEMLGQKAAGFLSSVLSAVHGNPSLAKCDPNSIIASAAVAATLDLPINSNLAFAHIVPYGNKAQFQMGWRGFVQLAIRTGQYRTMNVTPVYADQIKSYNPITGEYQFDNAVTEGEIIGYSAFFRMINGFEKTLYMNVGQIHEHAKKYSKSYSHASGQWQTNFKAMAEKTVLKMLLSKFGIMSIDIQKAVVLDQATPKDLHGNDWTYEDSTHNAGTTEEITGEVVETKTNKEEKPTQQLTIPNSSDL